MFHAIPHKNVSRCTSLSQEDFTEHYKDKSLPIIISDLTVTWPAKHKWSIEYLKKIAGDKIVPVYSSQPARDKQHQHAATKNLKLRDYLNMLKHGENDLRIFFYNILKLAPSMLDDFSYPELGMKFFKRLPVLFVGGAGTKVQMHYDIDLANLILCHFGGPKKVLLIPPNQTHYIYKVPYSFSALHDIDFSNPDIEKYPALKHLNGYVAELKHGDTLFIPSGFWHYVIYEDTGFSMTLRSIPTDWKSRLTLLKNIFITRNIDALMRKLAGQRWNDRNEAIALQRTNDQLPI